VTDHITNEEILRRSDTRRLQDITVEQRLRMVGHILRLSKNRPAKTWIPAEGKEGEVGQGKHGGEQC